VFPYYTMHGNAIPKEYEANVRRKALDNLIDAELVYQEAQRRKLQIPSREWQQRLSEIRKEYGSQAEFEATMKKYFGTREAFEKKLRHDMLLDKIYLLEVKQKSAVTAAEVRAYYDANQERYVQPESVSFQTISALFPNNATPADRQAARQRIEKLLPQARAAKNYEEFGILAEKASEDDYRVMMGEHKMVHRTTIAPEFAFVFSLKEGELSGIVESPAGYHIVRLNQHRDAKKLTFAEVSPSIRDMLEKQRLQERSKAFFESLRSKARVEVF
jgi:parvulin-like peptidyl-prolyl isomerase